MKSTKDLIEREIKVRGLDERLFLIKIEEIEFSVNNTGCKRCNSKKFLKTNGEDSSVVLTVPGVQIINTAVSESKDNDNIKVECMVCGYIQNESLNLIGKIKKMFCLG